MWQFSFTKTPVDIDCGILFCTELQPLYWGQSSRCWRVLTYCPPSDALLWEIRKQPITQLADQTRFCRNRHTCAFSNGVVTLRGISTCLTHKLHETCYSWPASPWVWGSWTAADAWRRTGTCSSRTLSPATWFVSEWRRCVAVSCARLLPSSMTKNRHCTCPSRSMSCTLGWRFGNTLQHRKRGSSGVHALLHER
jgi:hypothetical protein